MAQVTKNGRNLAVQLSNYNGIGTTREVLEVCSLLCRHAKTYGRMQVEHCNVEMSDQQAARFERKENLIEKRLADLVLSLPTIDGQFIKPEFNGDPRGYAFKLSMPDGSEIDVRY